MTWYYAENNQQRGPFTDAEFEGFVRTGKVTLNTLVWNETMTDWQLYSSLKPGLVSSAAPAAAPDPTVPIGNPAASAASSVASSGSQTSPTPQTNASSPSLESLRMHPSAQSSESVRQEAPPETVLCSHCNRLFRKDEVIRYGTVWVCGECKPAFLQRLKEGVPATSTLPIATFWQRFGAKLIDFIILCSVGMFFLFGIGAFSAFGRVSNEVLLVQVAFQSVFLLLNAAYSIFFIGRFGQTPGKMLLKIKVVNSDGSPVSYGKATGRYFAEILSGMVCYIGYIMAAFDSKEVRALHDHICSTRVVNL